MTDRLMDDAAALEYLTGLCRESGISIEGGRVRRSSSRFCLGVEHGDYNGTDLFGAGTDRFIWLGYRACSDGKCRLFSGNFTEEGIVEFSTDSVPHSDDPAIRGKWCRFAMGAVYVLQKRGFSVKKGIEGVLYGNIPGGGMSRSASLSLNLLLTLIEVNGIETRDEFEIVEMAQQIENEYIGSPCGLLDQVMIYYAKAGMGTYYRPGKREVEYVPLGQASQDFRFVVMDTGTVRAGLEVSTYKIRREECDRFAAMLTRDGYDVRSLSDIRRLGEKTYIEIMDRYRSQFGNLTSRLRYIHEAQGRFIEMLDAWRRGDIHRVGAMFRADGIGLRDDYDISGPELETMCDIARTVSGVYGERMLGGGDKGAAGALVDTSALETLKSAVKTAYPRSHPEFGTKFSVTGLRLVDGLTITRLKV